MGNTNSDRAVVPVVNALRMRLHQVYSTIEAVHVRRNE